MQLVVLGVNHKTAPVEVREHFSFSKEQIKDALNSLYEYESVAECVILSTCNRTEIYAVLERTGNQRGFMLQLLQQLKGQDKQGKGEALQEQKSQPEGINNELDLSENSASGEDHFFFYEGRAAIGHLFDVAASLDSLVVGEGQILSQLKMAYITAYSCGATGPVFNIVFQRAISAGKKIRTWTDIAKAPVSVSYTAVNLAADCLEDITKANVLILGAGQMSELTATHLQSRGVKSIFVSNRTYDRAVELANRFNGKAVHFQEFISWAEKADIIITSTGAPHYIIYEEQAEKIMAARHGRPIVMIDIAVPRDIDPEVGEIKGISLFNIDALEAVVEENRQHRLEEAEKARPMIEEAINELKEKLNYLSVRPMMVLLSEKAERIRRRELHRAMAKLPGANERERKIVEGMSRMLVRKLLREPMIRFGEVAGKEEEGEYWSLFRDMFKLEKEGQN